MEITGVIGTFNCIWYNVYNKRKKRIQNEHPNLRHKKVQRYKESRAFLKERGIKYQFIDMKEKSKGEFNAVAAVNGGMENMINPDFKDKDLLALIQDCITPEDGRRGHNMKLHEKTTESNAMLHVTLAVLPGDCHCDILVCKRICGGQADI